MRRAVQGRLAEAVEALLNIEKTQRLVSARARQLRRSAALRRRAPAQAADVTGTKLAVVALVRACFQAKAWAALNENVLLVSKRRSQLKQVSACAARAHASPALTSKRRLCRPSRPWCRSA